MDHSELGRVMRKIIIILLMALFAFALAACSSPAIEIKLLSQAHLNPDRKHHALPVLVRIYQLSQLEPFESATFHQLWQNDRQILGSTLKSRQEIIISPNSQMTVKVMPQKNAQYLAVVALFRKPEHHQWRLLKPMPGDLSAVMSSISIQLRGNNIEFVQN
jgi:type VI secretion system protein VasD